MDVARNILPSGKASGACRTRKRAHAEMTKNVAIEMLRTAELGLTDVTFQNHGLASTPSEAGEVERKRLLLPL